MNAFRRWLAILLIFLAPLPAWSAAGHCAPVADHPAVADAQANHLTHTTHADHGAAHATPASAAGGFDHDANPHASPCCGAVLPAPTFRPAPGFLAAEDFPLLCAHFASADQTTLKRPPKHSHV